MLLRFTKMHGLGNDFMVLDLVSQHAHILPKHAKQWGCLLYTSPSPRD